MERDRSGFYGHQTSSPGSLRDSKAMMSNRRALYRPAFFFEQRRPLICNMLCSSITRRSHSHAHTHTRSVCLLFPHAHTFCLHTHSSYLFSLCRQKTLKYVACPQNFGSFCCIFSYAIEKAWYLFFFFFVLFFCTDITNGYFNWNFWHCLHLVLEWQTSEWLARPGPGWLVCSEACLNQLAAWIARLILTGIHWNPLQFFFKQDSFFG